MQIEKSSNEQQKASNSVPVATVKPHSVTAKPRKSREHRSRSQEWPDVPDVGKIDERNPEILAQKILETGRQIEAGKIVAVNSKPNVIVNGHARDSDSHPAKSTMQRPHSQPQPQRSHVPPSLAHRHSPTKRRPLNVVGKLQESPKVINFEDRLKSIITSVLNEDQEHRKATRQAPPTHPYTNGYVRGAGVQPSGGGSGGGGGGGGGGGASGGAAAGYARATPRRGGYETRRAPEPPVAHHPQHAQHSHHAHHAHHAQHSQHSQHATHAHHAHHGHHAHSAHSAPPRHPSLVQPDYTQVNALFSPGFYTLGSVVHSFLLRCSVRVSLYNVRIVRVFSIPQIVALGSASRVFSFVVRRALVRIDAHAAEIMRRQSEALCDVAFTRSNPFHSEMNVCCVCDLSVRTVHVDHIIYHSNRKFHSIILKKEFASLV